MASTDPAGKMGEGEFSARKPGSEPLATSGHQPGQMVGNDAAPEFNAKTLPAGSAPKESTYKPNPIYEIPGQANNPDANETASAALDMPGATSGDVHQGIGKPIQGQSSAELAHDGKSHRARQGADLEGAGRMGGSGMTDEPNAEAKRLQEDHTPGPKADREHNTSLSGSDSLDPTS